MPIPLIVCRLKEDHSTIAEIGESALVYFPDWEPVPDDHLREIEARNNMAAIPGQAEPKSAEGPKDEQDSDDDSKAEEPKTARQKPGTRKAAEPAAKDKE